MILKKIREELKQNIDPDHKDGESRFFKERVRSYGVKTGTVRKIARKYFPKGLTKKEVFYLCEDLLKTGYNEESVIAFSWANILKNNYNKTDYNIFEKWLDQYVDNWAKCDDFCLNAFGTLFLKFPLIQKIILYSKDKNKWKRRASAVILIPAIKKDSRYLKDIFKIADILLLDQEDLVQKGYGWMLKESSNLFQKEVYDYIMEHKDIMPRISLRYAIEKMPLHLKKEAMKKGI